MNVETILHNKGRAVATIRSGDTVGTAVDALVSRNIGAEVMTRPVVTCEPTQGVDELMAEMTNRRIRHFPVVRNGRLCGIVSIGDVVKNRLDEIEYEAKSLRSFIAGA